MKNSNPSIFGIGNDIIEIDRVRQSIEKYGERLIDKLLTPKEKAYCLEFRDPSLRFAGRFAAKEAVVKALGCGFGEKAAWLEIEIINDPAGKPEVTLKPSLLARFGDIKILLSISHCKQYATAVAICTT